MLRIGIDIGGTFTDLAAADERGRAVIAKCASTPRDPAEGLLEGLRLLAAELGTDLRGLLARTASIVHGTTVATNALLERKGARVGLLTTEGHRDVLEMREGLKDDRYNLRMPSPVPLVPRARRLGVRERMRFDGTVLVPLGRASLAAALRRLVRAGVGAVAVCSLHASRSPAHERATGRALARRLPRAHVSLSSEVLPQIKEYERVWTTVVNAYVGPALARYLASLAARLRAHGYRGDVLIMQSHGGVAPVRESRRLAAGAVLSGPAGGVAAGRYCARLLGEGDLITFDMGGTSTDIALLAHGEPQLTGEKTVGGARVALPAIDIHTLGAGGGSVAWVDAGRVLHVGPGSAGRRRLGAFDGPVRAHRALDMRYGEEIFEIPVDMDGVDLDAPDLLAEAAARFHRRHEALYAYSAPGQEVVIVNARVAVVGELPVLPAAPDAAARGAAPAPGRRRVWLGGWGAGAAHP